LVAAEWSDKEGFLILNISEGESEDDHAIGVKEFCPIRDDD